ncbi:MAG: M23 family metallopeptidase [Candidatus Colwellbacteria bacterium]|nr:M23 family metallopeptidase [Candidatus Colwellbacteria bacterium]
MSLKEIIAQVSISAGHPQGTPEYNTAVNSSGDLQKSLLLRDPATGFYFVNREVVNECINSWLSWCNGGWSPANLIATNPQVTKNVIAKLAAYYKEANSGATSPSADYKQCVAAGSANPAVGADPAAALADEEKKEISLGLSQQIGKFYSFALGIGALVALGVLIFGGILYTASAGNASRQDDAKQWITGSIVGLIILFGSWFILNTVNPELTKLTDLRLLVNKAAEELPDSGGLSDSSPYPVIDGITCPVGATPNYSDDFCGPRGQGTRFDTTCLSKCGIPNCHGATDIFASYRTPVYAVADGTIGSSWGWSDIGGYRLHLITANGIDYYYAHLAESPVVSPGTSVKAGDLLGYVNHTGSAQGTPDHLHFEIHPTGEDSAVVDPYPFLQKVCSQ